jgi:hypothetical protein
MLYITMRLILTSGFILAFSVQWAEATCTGSSPNWTTSVDVASVTACVNNATDGDTVRIASGVATWTSGLVISKAITLSGAGIGSTIIKDGITNPNVRLIIWNLVPNKVSRMTGIEFQDGGRMRSFNGVVRVVGSYAETDRRRIRIDHCKFDHLNDHALEFFKAYGVVDHNIALYTATRRFAVIWGVIGSGSADDFGDGAWNAPVRFGTDQFLFFEDNTLTFDTGQTAAHTDSYAGARYVARYNIVTRGNFTGHGTESSGRYRGTRAMEVYGNRFFFDIRKGDPLTVTRSGSIIVHNNTVTGSDAILSSTCYRLRYVTNDWPPWGNSDGTNVWDVNEPGGPFTAGVVASSSGNTITVTGVSWPPNRWSGYSIRKTSGGTGATEIAGNTTNSITLHNGFNGNLTFNPGDRFEIWKVRQSLDCPGMGQSAFLGGLNSAILPRGGVAQVVEGMYEWDNYADGADVDFAPHEAITRPGEHYFNDTVRPGYTAYQYPHPLTLGVPAAPTNVRIVPN